MGLESWKINVHAVARHYDASQYEVAREYHESLSGHKLPDNWDPTDYLAPIDEFESAGNLITTAGLGRITSLVTGAGGQALTTTACRLGVGNSATAEAVGQTDLQAASGSGNRQFAILSGGYPTQSAGVMTFRAIFSTTVANFTWSEWCVDVGTPTVAAGTTVNALMLNRKVASLGAKTSTITATLTTTITLA